MINADHGQGQVRRFSTELDRDSRLRERRVDVVDRNRIVRVGGVTRDVAHDGKLAFRRCQRSLIDEGWNLGREVDAVYENVGLNNLLVWS